jgi:hypothetical protein
MSECVAENSSSPRKRPRLATDQVCSASNISIQSMLSVPPELIFRESQEKPLLTRAEGQCFMRINLVAQEMDALVLLAEIMLLQRNHCHTLRHKLNECHNPALRTVTVIASIFEKQSLPALRLVQRALSESMIELSSRSSLLRQSAEQNWSVAESLLDAMAGHSSQNLARDKRDLAELEEEVSKRIDGLVAMTTFNYQGDKHSSATTKSHVATRRNLFGRLPQNGVDSRKETMKTIYGNIFCLPYQKEVATVPLTKTDMYAQPDECGILPSEDAALELVQTRRETEESQNSFRKKSTAAAVLANLALGVQKE